MAQEILVMNTIGTTQELTMTDVPTISPDITDVHTIPTDTRDLEESISATNEFGHGPDGFAKLLASSTDKTTMVFRRYDELAIRNILRLSDILDEIDGKRESGYELAQIIKEYYEALLLYSKVLKLGAPASRTTQTLQDWLPGFQKETERYRPWNHYRLRRRDKPREYYSDLINLYTSAEDDLLSRSLYTWLWPFFIDKKASRRKGKGRKGRYYVDEGKIRVFVTIVNMMLAVALLVVAMWVLWIEGDNMIAKLATVTSFVVGFACWLGFFTSAGRKEMFSATSAYAAVLVVYVGSTTLPDAGSPSSPTPTALGRL